MNGGLKRTGQSTHLLSILLQEKFFVCCFDIQKNLK